MEKIITKSDWSGTWFKSEINKKCAKIKGNKLMIESYQYLCFNFDVK
jgi:hypothetical protein